MHSVKWMRNSIEEDVKGVEGFVMHMIHRIQDGTWWTTLIRRIKEPFVMSQRQVGCKQKKLLKHMLRYAMNHCSFYNGFSKNLKEYPIIDKHIISGNFEAFSSNIKNKYHWYDAYTGGSTGEPFHLLNSGGYEYAFGLRKWKEYGYRKGDKILALDGTKLSEEILAQGIYWCEKSVDDIPFGSCALSSLYFTKDNAQIYCNFISEFQPDFIRGYPSFVYSIACYAEQYGMSFVGIKGIELTSETAHNYQIDKIKKIFNTKVYLQYGHTEGCVFAYTYDETYRYKVEPLYGYIEILDENDEHVRENEIGEVVVTSLHNFAMPLIRYRTGDFAEYGGKDDKYIYLNRVLGRTQDYIIDKNGNQILLTALIFGQHFHAMGNIVKWQIEQYEKGKILIHIIKGQEYSILDEQELQQLFNELGNVDIELNYVTNISLTARGKSQMLIQHIKQ